MAQFLFEMQRVQDAHVRVLLTEPNEEVSPDNFEAIFFQDERMQKMFELYPEMIMVDATYAVDSHGLPLMTIMVTDGNGESHIAGLIILRSENNDSFRAAFNVFKELNPKHDKIEVILFFSFVSRKKYKFQIQVLHLVFQ